MSRRSRDSVSVRNSPIDNPKPLILSLALVVGIVDHRSLGVVSCAEMVACRFTEKASSFSHHEVGG